jgi:hypothetical protein
VSVTFGAVVQIGVPMGRSSWWGEAVCFERCRDVADVDLVFVLLVVNPVPWRMTGTSRFGPWEDDVDRELLAQGRRLLRKCLPIRSRFWLGLG